MSAHRQQSDPPPRAGGRPGPAVAASLPARLAEVGPGLDAPSRAYLDQVRLAAGRMAHRELDPADARGALEELAELVAIDVDVPTLSRRPAVRYLKGGVKQLGGWYLRYVAQQVTAFGTAAVAWGTAMSARADAIEEATTSLRRQVTTLEERVAALEEGRR